VYRRVTGSGDSCSPPLHSSVRENYSSFRFAVMEFHVLDTGLEFYALDIGTGH